MIKHFLKCFRFSYNNQAKLLSDHRNKQTENSMAVFIPVRGVGGFEPIHVYKAHLL